MRNTLLILTPVLALLIIVGGWGDTTPPAGFPTTTQIASLLQSSRPADFHDDLASMLNGGRLDASGLRTLLNSLDEIEREPDMQRQRDSVESYRAWLLAIHGHDQAALAIIRRLSHDPVPLSTALQADLAMLEASLELRANNASAASAAFERLTAIDAGAAQTLQQRLDFPTGSKAPGASESTWPLASVLWLILLVIPAAMMERERRLWLSRFPSGHDRIAPYSAFRRSPLAAFLATAGGLLVLSLGLPRRLGIGHDVACAIIYWLLSYALSLLPVHRLDCEVRKVQWSFKRFLSTVFRMHLLRALPVAAPLAAFFILRRMAVGLPWWGIRSPWAPGLAFAALTGAVLLLIPLILPALMGMKRISSDLLPRLIRGLPVTFYRWNLPGSGIANALSFGYLQASHAIAFTGELLDNSPSEDLISVAAHEEAHLAKDHLFLYFLAMLDLALAAGLWAALFPLAAERLLIFGPTIMQGGMLFACWLLCNRLFLIMGRGFEFEADAFAAGRVGREAYIGALARLTHANFMPVRVREGESAPGIHPSLAERKRALRERDGIVFEPSANPPGELVLALWRSRLALEWNRGETEAIHLCSLDDDPPADAAGLARLESIARRQAVFGAECLLDRSGNALEIIDCSQKTTIRKAEPPIPVERVCALCSGGMCTALKPDLFNWTGTQSGCRVSRQGT